MDQAPYPSQGKRWLSEAAEGGGYVIYLPRGLTGGGDAPAFLARMSPEVERQRDVYAAYSGRYNADLRNAHIWPDKKSAEDFYSRNVRNLSWEIISLMDIIAMGVIDG